MIVRAASDLHLSQKTAPWVWEALDALYQDTDHCGGCTVLCGDIFNQGVMAHMPTWNRLCDLLRNWPGTIFVIPGNHDQYDGYENILKGLKGGDCEVISEPKWTPIGRMLPHTAAGSFSSALQSLSEDKNGDLPEFIWCHHGFKGAYVNSNRRDTDGVKYSEIPLGHMVISGHYHMPQNLANLIYCGSPYECSFHEEGQAKGWLRWSSLESDPIPERVAYELSAPKHRTIHWDPTVGPPKPPEIGDHDIVRVMTSATRKEAQAAISQLEGVGLDSVPVLVGINVPQERQAFDPGIGIVEAAQSYANDRFRLETTGPEPEAMQDWAEEYELWQDLS